MQSILHTAKELLLPALRPGGTAADFTMGNGHDTLFLSRALPGGQVWAFDIQPAALKATQALLDNNSAGGNVRLILDSHSNLDRYIPVSYTHLSKPSVNAFSYSAVLERKKGT